MPTVQRWREVLRNHPVLKWKLTEKQIDTLAMELIRSWLEETKDYPLPAEMIPALKVLETYVLEGNPASIIRVGSSVCLTIDVDGVEKNYLGVREDFPLAAALQLLWRKATQELE